MPVWRSKRQIDSVNPPFTRLRQHVVRKVSYGAYLVKYAARVVISSPLLLVLALSSFIIPLSAFEAHVINVTATIENRPFCEARSIGYWRNHEGCNKGEGFSQWRAEINDLSATFSSIFATTSGEQICSALWVPNCPGGNSFDSKLCKAKAHTLADELNVVSNRLQLRALLAGADDGSAAFDNLGLSSSSKVSEALTVIEAILASSTSTSGQITAADYVAERIYAFYEDENPIKPFCIFNLSSLPSLQLSTENGIQTEEETNSFLQSNNAALISSTGELNEVYEEANEEQFEPLQEGGVTVEISPEVEIITSTSSVESATTSTTSTETIEASSESTSEIAPASEPESTTTEPETQIEQSEPSPAETQIESAPPPIEETPQ